MDRTMCVLTGVVLCTGLAVAQRPPQSEGHSGNSNPNGAAGTNTISEPAILETAAGTLKGTLELPASKAPYPVALIIAGSGPTDRDGNSPSLKGRNNSNSNKMLAQALAANGIASLRYDKRGIGESAQAISKEEDVRFDNLIDDAVLWGKRLRSDQRFGPLVVIGHSEGSLIGMIASQKGAAAAFVSLAGSGRPGGQIVLQQLRPSLSPELLKQVQEIITNLEQGRKTEDLPAAFPQALKILFRPSVQPYEISWFRYDPAKEIAKLKIPVLILQGSTDLQVSTEDANLLSQSNSSAKLVVINGMNHVLKEVPARDPATQAKIYADPTLPIASQLVSSITEFIMQLKK